MSVALGDRSLTKNSERKWKKWKKWKKRLLQRKQKKDGKKGVKKKTTAAYVKKSGKTTTKKGFSRYNNQIYPL